MQRQYLRHGLHEHGSVPGGAHRANFNCANWTNNSGGKLVVPFHNLDEPIGGSFGAGDIAQVLRLQD